MPENLSPANPAQRNSGGEEIIPEKTTSGKVDRNWNDEDVLPPVLSTDTEFVFKRMTEETLLAAHSANGHRILDVGCGRGIDAISLAKKGGILFGCEPSRVMIRKAKDWTKDSGEVVRLVSSLAEDLPFRNSSFARVVCKGAIDHFANPDLAVAEMCRVVSSAGKVVISLANFESLSCALGRKLNSLFQRYRKREIARPHIWEVPADHTFKFDYPSITALARRHMRIENIQGTSLFWGFPHWANILKKIPGPAALFFLRLLDRIASWHPPWSDVLVIIGKPRKNLSE